MSKKQLTTEEFIRKAKEVHGDKYDYSKVEYEGAHTKVCIICPEHGEFWQTPYNHTSKKCECPKCSGNARLTTEEFISRAKEIHGDKYDYSKVEFTSVNEKVCIICPEHGEFWIRASHFLAGHGCPKCAGNAKLTLEDFIRRAKEIHGDKYDYSKVECAGIKKKVCIICPEHGEFWQTLGDHLNGKGCPKCAGNMQSDTENFIRRAKEVHGNKYDYSKTEYVNAYTKLCIICPEHGEFWTFPNNHLKGCGCPKCASNAKLTTEEFIHKAKEVHGDKYDYSKVEYKGALTKVCIICPTHGEFWQIPGSHLAGRGCPRCVNNIQLSTDDFIKKAREVHGDKYDYSKVEYKGAKTKVCIICQEHGEFWQTPSTHLKGCKCPKCVQRSYKYTTEEFICRAKEVHGDKYDYSKAEYVNNHTEICIICPEHGEFWQIPYNHLKGVGCPCCNRGLTKQYKFNLLQEFKNEYSFKSFLENNDENILYVILRNIEPKYDPIKKDIEKALDRSFNENPIKALEEKYSNDSDGEEGDDETWAESETPETPAKTEEEPVIDLDDDEAVETILSSGSDAESEKTEPTIEDVINNTEQEIKVINKIEHLLTPEDRKYIMDKFLNDKRRAWMFKREKSVK